MKNIDHNNHNNNNDSLVAVIASIVAHRKKRQNMELVRPEQKASINTCISLISNVIFWPLLIFFFFALSLSSRCYYWIPIFRAEVDIQDIELMIFVAFLLLRLLIVWNITRLMLSGRCILAAHSFIRSLKLQRNTTFSNARKYRIFLVWSFDHCCQMYNYQDYFGFDP